ncbi:hypothetical protein MTR67_040043 [Solanum verrucosum]|uniref:Uncharacterized protein n=1 Tax=Solanum verrucosum TaxID=315347 RepID=A0AAF0UHX5_SOLVR|nr:hypothetical protein MTR67_040043 [Solanum verrucosum]
MGKLVLRLMCVKVTERL